MREVKVEFFKRETGKYYCEIVVETKCEIFDTVGIIADIQNSSEFCFDMPFVFHASFNGQINRRLVL